MASSVGRKTSSLEFGFGFEFGFEFGFGFESGTVAAEGVFEAWGTVLETPSWNGLSLDILLGV